MRRTVLALACVAVGVVLVLLAADLRRWPHRLAADDARFRAAPSHRDLWQGDALLPWDPARAVLAVDDDLAYRHALQLFWLSRLGADQFSRPELADVRARAQQQLTALARTAPDRRVRSQAANLLGVALLGTPGPVDQTARGTVLQQGVVDLQEAVRLDPTNDDAKLNLELALRDTNVQGQLGGTGASGGSRGGRASGAGNVGTGY
jgi:hypothetical protein